MFVFVSIENANFVTLPALTVSFFSLRGWGGGSWRAWPRSSTDQECYFLFFEFQNLWMAKTRLPGKGKDVAS